MMIHLLPFSKWHFSKTVDFCSTQGDLTLSFPIIQNPIVNLVFCSVYVKFKVYATCFLTSFSYLRTAFPVFKHPVPVLEQPYYFPIITIHKVAFFKNCRFLWHTRRFDSKFSHHSKSYSKFSILFCICKV
jgi:hypothetical protein